MTDTVKTEDVDFYNPHDALKTQVGRYLDDVEREDSEELRSVVEDRDPDYSNVPANAGTPLVTKTQFPTRVGVEREDVDPFLEGVTVEVAVDPTVSTDGGDTTTISESTEQVAPVKRKATPKDVKKVAAKRPAKKATASKK